MRAAQEAGHGGDAGEARVGRDEIALVGDERWHQRALGDGIRLVEHEDAEHLGIQQQVLDVARDEEAQDAAAEARRRRDDALRTGEAVDERTDERCEQEEGRERHEQVGNDAWTCRADGHVEEQRPRERDREEGVRGVAGRMRRRQPGERHRTQNAGQHSHRRLRPRSGKGRAFPARSEIVDAVPRRISRRAAPRTADVRARASDR